MIISKRPPVCDLTKKPFWRFVIKTNIESRSYCGTFQNCSRWTFWSLSENLEAKSDTSINQKRLVLHFDGVLRAESFQTKSLRNKSGMLYKNGQHGCFLIWDQCGTIHYCSFQMCEKFSMSRRHNLETKTSSFLWKTPFALIVHSNASH